MIKLAPVLVELSEHPMVDVKTMHRELSHHNFEDIGHTPDNDD